MKQTNLHCIFCGSILEPYSKEDENEYFGSQSEPIKLHCIGDKCHIKRDDGIYLILHHPTKGINCSPGDSFSISWVK